MEWKTRSVVSADGFSKLRPSQLALICFWKRESLPRFLIRRPRFSILVESENPKIRRGRLQYCASEMWDAKRRVDDVSSELL